MLASLLTTEVPGRTTPEMLEECLQDPTTMKWYIVPLFVIMTYFIATELRNRNFNVLMGAAAYWLADVFNETWNSMVYACTGQPVWGTTAAGGSAFQILIGYNIEISIMFFILGMYACKLLKVSSDSEGLSFWDGNKNWKTDPNNMYYMFGEKNLTPEQKAIKKKAIMGRVLNILIGAAMAVFIEILLNLCGVLTWEKAWWQPTRPLILFIIGYCPFFTSAYIIHDLPRKKQLIGLGIQAAIVIGLLIVAGSLDMLGPQIPLGFPHMK